MQLNISGETLAALLEDVSDAKKKREAELERYTKRHGKDPRWIDMIKKEIAERETIINMLGEYEAQS